LTAAELLSVAHNKHGVEGFNKKRQDVVEKEVEPHRTQYTTQMEKAQATHPVIYQTACQQVRALIMPTV